MRNSDSVELQEKISCYVWGGIWDFVAFNGK